MTLEKIRAVKAPEALGHYEQGIKAGNLIFTAMQLPINPAAPDSRAINPEDMAAQLIMNVIEIVRAGGGDIANIAKVTIYLSDIALWEPVNAAYIRIMGSHKPARSMVPVKELHKGWPMAMEAIAIL